MGHHFGERLQVREVEEQDRQNGLCLGEMGASGEVSV